MPLDFAGLGALSGVNNWAEIRQEKQAEQQRIAVLNAMQQQELAGQQEAARQVQEHLNTIGQIHVLDQDRKAIQDKDMQLQKSIQEGVKKYNGNVKKYLLSGGLTELSKYQQNLANSEEVQRGLMNAFNYNRWQTDVNAGLTPREIPGVGSFNEQFDKYQKGDVKDLRYAGSFKMPGFNDKSFQERYGNKERAYQEVSPQDFYYEALDQFKDLPEQDRKQAALYHTENYIKGVKQGRTPLSYKFDDPQLQANRKLAEIKNAYQIKILQDKITNGLKSSIDWYGDLLSGKHGVPDGFRANADVNSYHGIFGAQPDPNFIGQTVPISTSVTPLAHADLKKATAKTLGLEEQKAGKDKEGGYVGKIWGGDKALFAGNLSPLKTNLNATNFTVKDIKGTVSIPSPDGKSELPYALLEVSVPKGQMVDLGGATTFFHNPTRATETDLNVGGGRATTEILVPMPTDIMSRRIAMNEGKKLQGKLDSPYASMVADEQIPDFEEYAGEPVKETEGEQ